MCAGLLMLDKAPRDPIKGSIMQLCIRRTKKKKRKKESGNKGQEYIKKVNSEERGGDEDKQ